MEGLDDLEFLSEYREDNPCRGQSGPRAACPQPLGDSTFRQHPGRGDPAGVAEAQDGPRIRCPPGPGELVEEFWSIVQDPCWSAPTCSDGRRAADAERAEHGGGHLLCPGQISPAAGVSSLTYGGTYYRCGGRGPPQPPARGGGDAQDRGKQLSDSEDGGDLCVLKLYPGADQLSM